MVTSTFTHRKRGLATIAVAALLGGGLSACGRSSSDGAAAAAASASGSHKTAKELVPERIRKTGVLKVATAEGYPPMEMYAKGTTKLIGIDPELGKLIADQLGLKFKITNASFPGLIPGLQSQQWDLAMSSMSDTAQRRAAVNFVDYFTSGGSIVVKKGNPLHIKTLADLCGRKIVAAKGSSNLAIVQKYNTDKCGAKKMILSQSEDAPTGLLQIDTNRAVASMVDYPVAKNLAKAAGKYDVLSTQYEAGPWGIAINKSDNDLTAAISAAVDELIHNGKYAALLKEYDVSGSAVDKASINAGN